MRWVLRLMLTLVLSLRGARLWPGARPMIRVYSPPMPVGAASISCLADTSRAQQFPVCSSAPRVMVGRLCQGCARTGCAWQQYCFFACMDVWKRS
jgi:hypothetical protein